jgi:MoxR-like ATPase
MATLSLTYTGEVQPQPDNKTKDYKNFAPLIADRVYPYDPEPELIEAVNVALDLKMPLLLEGEPGCGKSRLAHALVYEFNKGNPKTTTTIKYHEWIVQSTSKAEDSLYQYDYIGRLQAAQVQGIIKQPLAEDKNPKDPAKLGDWVDYRPLGKAFKESQDHNIRSVVLIDEIDKADRDFPNDLLLTIEKQEFTIKETGDTIRAREESSPIIIITSNQEKRLPNAFLRRCIYHYIELPSPERLTKILETRFLKYQDLLDKKVIDKAVERFLDIRESQVNDKIPSRDKIVSTAELIAWFQSFLKYDADEILKKLSQEKIPHAGALLKTYKDYGGRD